MNEPIDVAVWWRLLFVGMGCILGIWVSLFLHECAHAVTALLLRLRVVSFQVGVGPGVGFTVAGRRIDLRLAPARGSVYVRFGRRFRAMQAVLLAGPLASVLLSVASFVAALGVAEESLVVAFGLVFLGLWNLGLALFGSDEFGLMGSAHPDLTVAQDLWMWRQLGRLRRSVEEQQLEWLFDVDEFTPDLVRDLGRRWADQPAATPGPELAVGLIMQSWDPVTGPDVDMGAAALDLAESLPGPLAAVLRNSVVTEASARRWPGWEGRCLELARAIHVEDPDNEAYADTYGCTLAVAGRCDEALPLLTRGGRELHRLPSWPGKEWVVGLWHVFMARALVGTNAPDLHVEGHLREARSRGVDVPLLHEVEELLVARAAGEAAS